MDLAIKNKRRGLTLLLLFMGGSNATLELKPKSLYRSRAGRHFYGTENVIWADFGPVGNTEKKIGPIMSNF